MCNESLEIGYGRATLNPPDLSWSQKLSRAWSVLGWESLEIDLSVRVRW